MSATAVLTPTARTVGRRWTGALVIGAVVIVVAAILTAVVGLPSQPVDLGVDDASPAGGRAVAQVLRQQGVDVRAADSLAEATAAAADPSDTTVMLIDDRSLLDAAALRRLRGIADHLVLVQPDFRTLRVLAPEVSAAGEGTGTESGCELGGLTSADRVLARGSRYVADDPSAVSCLGDDEAGYGLVRLSGDVQIDVLGARDALHNDEVGRRADGAFALGLLGASPRLVWYSPGAADVPVGDRPASIDPGWYTPLVALLALIVLAAILWRARRFGPLAIENLPVVVPASETMEGRARLYGRSSSRLRALDALRLGTIRRLSRLLALPRTASLVEVVARTAEAVNRPAAEVGALLVDLEPAGDADLTRLSDELLLLERAVAHAVTPAPPGPPRGGS